MFKDIITILQIISPVFYWGYAKWQNLHNQNRIACQAFLSKANLAIRRLGIKEKYT